MHADHALQQLAASDPARRLPSLAEDRRERLRHQILASRHGTLRRQPRRRYAIAVATALTALVVTGAGWALYRTVLSTPAEVSDDFTAWTQRVPLPLGERWQQPDLGGGGLYGDQAAAMIVTGIATCDWFAYWLAAHDRHDAAQLRAAGAEIAHVRSLLPVHPAGAPEEAGGYSLDSLRLYDRIIAEQGAGRSAQTEQYLRANC